LHDLLADLVARYQGDDAGEVATYIPQLATADPGWFGLALVTMDGVAYEAGDCRQPFTIQSISKPFAYALALEQRGPDDVNRRVGVEPSGEAFNSISLSPGTGRPLNPMINAGAIAVSSLVNDTLGPRALQGMLDFFGRFAGRTLEVDEQVYESERSTGHRNRAIAHLLRNFDIVGDAVEAGLDLYFKQCSILVTCRDLAVMAATLANHGVNPVTGKRAMSAHHVEDVLSVMTTCGMYNYAGQWLYDVGVPAKSGVSGGILAVLPGRMGIAAFSPRLDAQGNSVRGVKACQEFSERFGLHLFGAQHSGRAVIRSETTLATRSSIHVRPSADARRLKSAGATARVIELQGNLHFSAMEIVQRRIWEALDETDIVVLDFSRVDSVDAAAAEGAARLAARLADYGRQIVFVALASDSEIPPLLGVLCPSAVIFADLEQAIDVCERSILGGFSVHSNGKPPTETSSTSTAEHVAAAAVAAAAAAAAATLTVAELEVAADLDASERRRLDSLLTLKRLDAGEAICRRGDRAGHVFFLACGSVSVRLYRADGTFQPLAVFVPGSVFGEMAIIDGGRRSADVWTESPAAFYALSVEDFDGLDATAPSLKIKMLHYLLRILTLRLRRGNALISQLAD
jgi:glutaminase